MQGRLVDGRYHGLAVACFVEGGAAGPRESARMVLENDGRISLYVGSSAVGQGVETILMQIAADAMELPLDAITVFPWFDELREGRMGILSFPLDGDGRQRRVVGRGRAQRKSSQLVPACFNARRKRPDMKKGGDRRARWLRRA